MVIIIALTTIDDGVTAVSDRHVEPIMAEGPTLCTDSSYKMMIGNNEVYWLFKLFLIG